MFMLHSRDVWKKLRHLEEKKQLKKIKRIVTKDSKGKIKFITTNFFLNSLEDTFSYSIVLQNEVDMRTVSIDYHPKEVISKIIEIINNEDELVDAIAKDYSNYKERASRVRDFLKSLLLMISDILEDDGIKLLIEVS